MAVIPQDKKLSHAPEQRQAITFDFSLYFFIYYYFPNNRQFTIMQIFIYRAEPGRKLKFTLPSLLHMNHNTFPENG